MAMKTMTAWPVFVALAVSETIPWKLCLLPLGAVAVLLELAFQLLLLLLLLMVVVMAIKVQSLLTSC
jgi:hypothetical protein